MTLCISRTKLYKKYTAESFHLKTTQNQQEDAVPGNAVKFHWSSKLLSLPGNRTPQKKQCSKPSPLKSKKTVTTGLDEPEPKPLSQRARRGKRKSNRNHKNKAQYLCLHSLWPVHYAEVCQRYFAFQMNMNFSPWQHSFSLLPPMFHKFHIQLGVK